MNGPIDIIINNPNNHSSTNLNHFRHDWDGWWYYSAGLYEKLELEYPVL
jgi:hypothetical protein